MFIRKREQSVMHRRDGRKLVGLGLVAAVAGVVLFFLGVSWAGAVVGAGAVAGAKGALMLQKRQQGGAAEKVDPES